MTLWTVVIIVLAIAMLCGPVLMLRPTPGQKRQERLRTRAMHRGLKVRMEALPQLKTDLETPKPMPVYAVPGVPVSAPWQLVRAAYNHESHFLGSWCWCGRGQASAREQAFLTQWLPTLPDTIPSVGADRRSWYLAWQEREEALLDEIESGLRKLADAGRDVIPPTPPATDPH